MKPSSASVQRIVMLIRTKRKGQDSINIATVEAGPLSACNLVSRESPGCAPRFFSRFSTCLCTVRKNSVKWLPWLFDRANIAVANAQRSNFSAVLRVARTSSFGRMRTKASSVAPSVLCSTFRALSLSSVRTLYLSASVKALCGAFLRFSFPSFEINQMKGVCLLGRGAGSHHAFR